MKDLLSVHFLKVESDFSLLGLKHAIKLEFQKGLCENTLEIIKKQYSEA